jgi:T5orf172 domain
MGGRAGPGWVYVLTHPAWDKLEMVKIGRTGRDPRTRAAEITAVSGLLAPCTIAWCSPVVDMAEAELAVHRMLGRHRVRKRRELFRIDVATARQVIEAIAAAPPCLSPAPAIRPAPVNRAALVQLPLRSRRPVNWSYGTRSHRAWHFGRRREPIPARVIAAVMAIGAVLLLRLVLLQ